MKVRDIMTWNVVTVSSDTPIMEAKKIMEAHSIRRLPVVDKGKLVGVITKDGINRASPSEATSLSIWEINYLLAKMTVKDIMRKDVITISPDMSVEAAVALAQSKHIGALLVAENNRLIGIATTDDFFYKILNPILGIGKPGIRLTISSCANAKCIADIMNCVAKHNIKIVAVHNEPPVEGKEADLYLHLDTDNADKVIKDLKDKGYTVEVRER
jgi:acetoin utilization protein AcuB